MRKPIETVYAAFGMRIRMMRESLGMTQAELATGIGLTRTSIANIEAGRQRILLADVEKFARWFHVSPKSICRSIWP